MDSGTLFLVTLALGLAGGAGYVFGWQVPSWQEDYHNDPHPSELEMPRHWGWWHIGGSTGPWCAMGCVDLFGGMIAGSKLLPLAMLAAALVLMLVFAWPERNAAFGTDDGLFLLLFDTRLWLVLGAAAVGYVVAVVTDKGPVGPLE